MAITETAGHGDELRDLHQVQDHPAPRSRRGQMRVTMEKSMAKAMGKLCFYHGKLRFLP